MRHATRRLSAFLILTALAACDNVEWSGQSVKIVPPPPHTPDVEPPTDVGTAANLGLPSGTVLFHVSLQGQVAQVVPVAEVAGDSLRTLRRPAGVSPEAYEERFRATVLPPNTELVLFRRGAEVGTVQVTGPAALTPCGVPTATGRGATVAAAADQTDFLAFRRGLAPEVMGEYAALQIDGSIRRYASIVAERLVLQNGLPRPRSWTGAQRDVQPLDVVRGGNLEMAATYLSGDNLGVGPGEEGGYAVFYVASYETRSGYTPVYSDVRDYRRTGKAAPRLVDYLNWNGKGGNEMLIQVFGPDQSWYEAVSADAGGRWERVWQGSPCQR